jgi:hypothetical protein
VELSSGTSSYKWSTKESITYCKFRGLLKIHLLFTNVVNIVNILSKIVPTNQLT